MRDPDHRDAAALAHHRDALAERGRVARALERDLGAAAAGPLADRLDRVLGGEVDRLVAERGRLRQPRAAADDDHAAGAERARALGHEQPHHAGSDDHDRVARRLPAALDRVQRDRGGSSIAASSSDSASGTAKTLLTECTT